MRKHHTIHSPFDALQKLISGNAAYKNTSLNPADISILSRLSIAKRGQKPYAVILTCSDSFVPPEHIFSAGIGELFVVRTAGNVIGDFELGSVEYGTAYLNAKIVVVLGHNNCSILSAAADGRSAGHISDVVHEIYLGISRSRNLATAIQDNLFRSKAKIMESAIIQNLVNSGELSVVLAIYDDESGEVRFLEN